MTEGVPTLAPFAHVVFCQNYPTECRPGQSRIDAIELTSVNSSLLRRVNAEVNKTIRPVNDQAGLVGDTWSLSPRKGDCEDFAITKRHRLIQAGLPASALRLVTAMTPSGEGHAALVVSTDRGDMILDNRFDEIQLWTKARLTFLKLQSASDPRRWFDVSGQAIASNMQ